jgi:cytochrome P450
LRNLWRLRRDPMWPWIEGIKTYGDIAVTRIPGVRQFTVYRPRHAEHVLVTNQDNYVKGSQYELFGMALGDGLVTSNGELWRRQRRLVQPLFAKRHIDTFAEHMTAAATQLFEQWATVHDGGTVDVAEAMMGLTLDVVGRALFGSDLTGRVRDTIRVAMRDVLAELQAAAYSPLTWAAYSLPRVTMERALRLRPLRQRRFHARMGELDQIVAEMIENHRSGAQRGTDDLLTLLLDARDEETGAAMDDRQLRDEVITFLAAGHETTANALSWMWVLLSQHPDARARLCAEVDELLDGRIPTFEDADRLPWTRAVVHETLRLYPPVWIVGRRALHEDNIDGVSIPSGANVAVLIYLTHRDPNVWPNPEGFDPGRFLPGQPDRPRCAYIPFTAGRRICVGNTFALTEATLLTAMIAQHCTLDLDPTERVEPQPLLVLRPNNLMMRLHHR